MLGGKAIRVYKDGALVPESTQHPWWSKSRQGLGMLGMSHQWRTLQSAQVRGMFSLTRSIHCGVLTRKTTASHGLIFGGVSGVLHGRAVISRRCRWGMSPFGKESGKFCKTGTLACHNKVMPGYSLPCVDFVSHEGSVEPARRVAVPTHIWIQSFRRLTFLSWVKTQHRSALCLHLSLRTHSVA